MLLSMRRRVQELVRKAAEKAGVTIERLWLTTSVGPATFRLRASRLIGICKRRCSWSLPRRIDEQ
jgi:hypothetical protein